MIEDVKQQALEFLKSHKTAVVATVSKEGEPQASTVFYSIDDDFTFNFITDKSSRKFQNLQNNPRLAIVVGYGPDVITIQCGGRAEIVDYGNNTIEAETIITKVMKNSKLGGTPPELPVLMNPEVIIGSFTVKPEWMVLLNLEYQKFNESYKHEYSVVLP